MGYLTVHAVKHYSKISKQQYRHVFLGKIHGKFMGHLSDTEVLVAKCWSQLQDEMSGAHLHLFGAALPRLDWRYLRPQKSQNTVLRHEKLQ